MSYIYNKIVVKVKRKVRLTKIALTTKFPTIILSRFTDYFKQNYWNILNGSVISYGIKY